MYMAVNQESAPCGARSPRIRHLALKALRKKCRGFVQHGVPSLAPNPIHIYNILVMRLKRL